MDILKCYNFINKSDVWDNVFMFITKKSDQLYNHISKTAGGIFDNANKNRYKDVIPFDNSRVILGKKPSKCDYINASFVKSDTMDTQYILTQGPLPTTISNFWQMVWEQQCQILIMLCNIMENGREKCAKYYPENIKKVVTYGRVKVEATSIELFSGHIIRTFLVSNRKSKESRTVVQAHFTEWPDFGIPVDCASFTEFIEKLRNNYTTLFKNPVVVHCSAGIGRTGSFVLVDSVIQEIKEKQSFEGVDPIKTLLNIRGSRHGLIQTSEQFSFSYRAIIFIINKDFKSLAQKDQERVNDIFKLPNDELMQLDYIPFKSVHKDVKNLKKYPDFQGKLSETRKILISVAKNLNMFTNRKANLPIKELSVSIPQNVPKIGENELNYSNGLESVFENNSKKESYMNENESKRLNSVAGQNFNIKNKELLAQKRSNAVNNYLNADANKRCFSVVNNPRNVNFGNKNCALIYDKKISGNVANKTESYNNFHQEASDRPKRPANRQGIKLSNVNEGNPKYQFDAGVWFVKYHKYICRR